MRIQLYGGTAAGDSLALPHEQRIFDYFLFVLDFYLTAMTVCYKLIDNNLYILLYAKEGP